MRFLNHLVEEGVLPLQTFQEALGRHGRKETRILQELRKEELLNDDTLLKHMSAHYKLPIVDLHETEKDPEAMKVVTFEHADRYGVFPLKISKDSLTVAISDPSDFFKIDDLRALSGGRRIQRVLSRIEDIRIAIERYYRLDDCLHKAVKELSELETSAALFNGMGVPPGLEDGNSPISKTVRRILENAIQTKASDIHFEPQEETVELRYRVDGHLKTIQTLPLRSCAAIVARIKILCHMDIAEKRKPQDGRGRMVFRGQRVDLRVSTLPTLFGEKVVIRLLNQESLVVESLDSLGFDAAQREAYLKAITSKQGIVLVTGPTGSGKTTTLYSSLNRIKSGKHNITTIEDPIEYLLAGINQTQIHPKIGVTFASMLRSILRQDPDVILVGEIRDRETADTAFQSSLTGHLVFSTLHTNSAVSAVTRLYDIGLEPYLVGSALLCIVAQRLVRVICDDCRERYVPDPAILEQFKGFLPQRMSPTFYRGRGCVKCSDTGFRGRAAVFEVLPATEEIRAAVSARASEEALYRKARTLGFKTMVESAIEKALEGRIPLEEAIALLPTYENKENDLFMQLADFIDSHQPQRLAVVKNEELIRKILLHASPQDYTLIEPTSESAAALQDNDSVNVAFDLPLLPNGTSSGERRRHPRIVRDFMLKFRSPAASIDSQWEMAIVKDLSVEGCYFRAAHPLPVGHEVDVQVQLPISREMMPAKAVVRHCQNVSDGENSHFLGVSFQTVAPKGRNDLRRVVNFFLNKKSRTENAL